jgi:large subunit ribosomal protein L28
MRLYSDALGVFTSLRITARALSTVEKVGGLDIYLLNTNPDKLSRAALSLRNILITKLSEAL